jgi:hypothetical protein
MGLDGPSFEFWQRYEGFLVSKMSKLLYNGYQVYFSTTKWPGLDVNYRGHPEPRLRMSGAVNMLSLNAFME